MAALNDLFDPRRHGRQALPGLASAGGDWESEAIELTDVSPGGFAGASEDPPQPGSSVRIAIPGLGFRGARVKWSSGRRFGAEFENPADLRLLFLGGPVERCPTWIERSAV